MQLALSPPAVPLCLRGTSRPGRSYWRGSRAAMACRRYATTLCSSENSRKTTGLSTRPLSIMKPPPTSCQGRAYTWHSYLYHQFLSKNNTCMYVHVCNVHSLTTVNNGLHLCPEDWSPLHPTSSESRPPMTSVTVSTARRVKPSQLYRMVRATHGFLLYIFCI